MMHALCVAGSFLIARSISSRTMWRTSASAMLDGSMIASLSIYLRNLLFFSDNRQTIRRGSVVAVAELVPPLLRGLHPPRGVGGPHHQHHGPRPMGMPSRLPSSPAVGRVAINQLRVHPADAGVIGQLDAHDLATAGPRVAGHPH